MEECYADNRRENHDRDDDDDQELFTELDMAAAQQLMQLSDEENHSNKENIIDDHDGHEHDEEVDQRLMKIINNRIPRVRSTMEKIEEIFGKEEEEEEKDEELCGIQPPKKRKYRSLASIYRETKTTRDDDHDIITFGKTKKKKSS